MSNPVVIPASAQANRPLVSVGGGNTVKWGSFPYVATNNAWAAVVNTTTGITASAYTTPSGLTVTVTGFSSYLLQVTFVAQNLNASSRTINTRFQDTGNNISYSSGVGYTFTTNQIGTITNAYKISNLLNGLSYSFDAQINFPVTAGTVYNATFTVIGLS